MRRMPKSRVSWLIPRLRRISLAWPGKSAARDLAKRYIQDGTYKNGNPKIRAMYECAECARLGKNKIHYEREETQMDHIEPVVRIGGFQNWDDYISRLFCEPSGYQCLCTSCHDIKTAEENRNRPGMMERRRSYAQRRANLTRSKKYAKIKKDSGNNDDGDIFARRKKLAKKIKRGRIKTSVRKRYRRG